MKEKEPVNYFAHRMKEWADLSDAVKQKIDEVLNSKTFSGPHELADTYLSCKATSPKCSVNTYLPINLLSDFENDMKEFLANVSASKVITPKALKSVEDDFWKEWQWFFEEMKGRIARKTMQNLEKKYAREAVERVIEALVDFEVFLRRNSDCVKVVDDKSREAFAYFKKKHTNVINATEFLIKGAGLSATEKELVLGIQSRHKDHLKRLSQIKKITLDPIKADLLNRAATPTLVTHSTPEAWIEEFYLQCHKGTIFIKPAGRPKKIVFNALVIVIFRLLENKDTQVKWRYALTADIINQCFHLSDKEELTAKKIDNILHST